MPTKIEKDAVTGTETTGHEWDDIKELNTPLPRWWLPALGEPVAAPLSALVLCAIIVLAAWWLVLSSHRRQPMLYWWLVGGLWVALTAGFKLGFFHYLMGEPLAALLMAYDPRYGYFGLVQLTALLAPPALVLLGRGRARDAHAPQ